jgi:putative Ca2+/H+ antiporter (TMEM165/GDT1 family)
MLTLSSFTPLFVSIGATGLAEIGDKTQWLTLALAARYRRPLPIALGIVAATLLNHAMAAFLGASLNMMISADILHALVAVSFLIMAVWLLVPDEALQAKGPAPGGSVFLAAFISFFMAEMGDKTQIATIALAARFYPQTVEVVIGTTLGIILASLPCLWLGEKICTRIPFEWVRRVAAALYAVIGIYILVQRFL